MEEKGRPNIGRLKYLWRVSAGQRGYILVSCLVGAIGAGFALAFIYASKQVIDIAAETARTTGAGTPGNGGLLHASLLTILLLLAQLLCNAADTWLGNRMEVRTSNALRHRLFSRLLQSRWNELERFHTGDVVNRVEKDTAAIVTLLTSSIPSFIVTGIQLLTAFLFFCFLDPLLPWLLLSILPIGLLGGRFYSRRMRGYTHDIRRSDSRIQSVIQESLQHRMVLKALEQTDSYLDKLNGWQDRLHGQVMERTRFLLSTRILVYLTFSGGYLTAFLWGAVRLSTGSITFGTMAAFLQLVGRVQRPAFDLSRLVPSFIEALAAIDRLLELEELPAEPAGKSILFDAAPDLELSGVTFGYTSGGRLVFDGLSCRFPAGSCTAITGKTGRGKTTLIRLLLALSAPQKGTITLTGHRRQDSDKHSATPALTSGTAAATAFAHAVSPQTRVNFVYVPQGNTLFSGTIRDNLLMGRPQASEVDMRRALRTAAADFVFRLPAGMDTPLDEQGGGLSEGQAQRIAIARALLRPGHILLLDEATSALDPATERRLMSNLRRDCAGKTLIFVTHHPAIAEACEAVVEL
ncbi:ABC transporter ATP-binding protein [Bacteroides heparinolyticus]|uniref:ABC transporter ATP-binding protein n=1 Tax=Prevotella heparinolytica TaxID=28113 RepID=A0A3P2AC28_9BACE|nr:ABC transporter ATP-binding protein [Bacteroides heparinolyticus]RRD93099.1 ABC transporter ATP-binding protein [Bacteroides heparinolyticus]